MKKLLSVRFTVLIVHFLLLLNYMWAKDDSSRACYTQSNYPNRYDKNYAQLRFVQYFSVSLVALETLACMTGVSIFFPTIAILSLIEHLTGSLVLIYQSEWSCSVAWTLMIVTCFLPLLIEAALLVSVFVFGIY